MISTDVIVIGAGQAGLATSHCLSERGIDHVVLERGQVAQRWRSERWDSLQLLTPNWQSRLPGYAYRGSDPDGFMSMPEVIGFFERYAAIRGKPIRTETRVRHVRSDADGFRVLTDRGELRASNVVVATGYCDVPAFPAAASGLSPDVFQLAASAYKRPSKLPAGGVLVVGASASGLQIADELARSGRDVVLAVGGHTRLPRRYRGADIMRWLDRIGSLDETTGDVRDLRRARAQSSLQLIGSTPARDLDLGVLARHGVRIHGRLLAASGQHVVLAGDLAERVRAADDKLTRLLDRIDRWIDLHPELSSPPAPRPKLQSLHCDTQDRAIGLAASGISTVLFATGFRRDYRFLQVPVFDAAGEISHDRGITRAPGLYAMGLRFQHTRKSTFIDGVARDAELITRHIAGRLGARDSYAA